MRHLNSSKFHRMVDPKEERMGRFYRAEKKYGNSKTHCGKGKTLRTHRNESRRSK